MESRLYLRSRELWIGLAIVWLALVGMMWVHWPSPPELLFTLGDFVPVPMTALVTILAVTMGFGREERESFGDIWNSLPVRNADQYWGKIWGTRTVMAVFVFGWLLVLPVVWYLSDTAWSPSAASTLVGYVAQVAAALLLGIGIAASLHSAIPNVWVRAAVGVGIILAFSLVQRFDFDDSTQWGVLLSPYIVGGVPYGHSSLFGMFPWERAVLWHVLFQIGASLALVALGGVMYQRRRDPARSVYPGAAAVLCLVALAGVSAAMYQRHWRDVDQTVLQQMAYDAGTTAPAAAVSGGLPATGTAATLLSVIAYDLTINAAEDGVWHIVAALTLAGVEGGGRFPLTLHHQWSVLDVAGPSVARWEREANVVWMELRDDAAPTVTITYAGRPFLWHRWAGRLSPFHFVSARGGYLTPLMAWYPLPGYRQLVDASDGYLRLNGEPILTAPAEFRVQWSGPQSMSIVSNLADWEREETDGRQNATFRGHSDGVSIFFGPLERERAGDLQLAGASSLVRWGTELSEPYEKLYAFYAALLGRSIPREPVIIVPDWLLNIYTEYRWSPLERLGRYPLLRTSPLLGAVHVLGERELVAAVAAAREWRQTQTVESFFAATEWLHHGLLQSVWGRPHVHRSYLQNPVHKGLAEYTVLQWAHFVAGTDFDSERFEQTLAGRPRTAEERLAAQVLSSLQQLEQTHGRSAVQRLLGLAYDRLETSELDWGDFQALLQTVRGEIDAVGQPES